MRERIAWILVLPVAALCGFIDVTMEEIFIPAVMLLLAAAVLTFLAPRRWPVWALFTGGSMPVAHAIVRTFGILLPYPPPGMLDTLLAFVPSLSGCALGYSLAHTISTPPSGDPPPLPRSRHPR